MIGTNRNFNLPHYVSRGEPVTAEEHNKLVRALHDIVAALRDLTPRPSPDIGYRATAGGYTSFIKKKRGGTTGREVPRETIVPQEFRLVKPEESSPVWHVVFTSARLWEHSLRNGSAAHRVKVVGFGFLDDEPTPEDPDLGPPLIPLAYEPGDPNSRKKPVWLRWIVTEDCGIEEESVKLSIGEKPEGNPFIPHRPRDFGDSGTYVQRLGTIVLGADAETAPIWKPESPHAVVHISVPRIEQVGEGVGIFYDYVEGTDRYKKLRNADASEEMEDYEGAPEAQLLVDIDGSEDFEEVRYRQLIFSGSVDLFSEQTDNAIVLRGLKAHNAEAINVFVDEDDAVSIRGEGYTRSDVASNEVVVGMETSDGIVRSYQTVVGQDLALSIWWSRFTDTGHIITPSPQHMMTLYFVKGIFVGTVAPTIEGYDPLVREITWVSQGT